MVLLTQTPAIISALEEYATHTPLDTLQQTPSEPSLDPPTPGAPISHSQMIQIFHTLKDHNASSHPHLPDLLHGSKLYIPPPPPKPEPSNEYKALMARLRAEQEAREYKAMLTTATGAPSGKNPYSRFAAPNSAGAWDLGSDVRKEDEGSDSMQEVDAQISLIVNVVVSVLACGGTFFLLLRYTGWSEGVRVLASMFGAFVVGLAEMVVYAGFVRRTDEAMRIEKGKREEREIQETWVIEGKEREKEMVASVEAEPSSREPLRRRKGRTKSQDRE